MTAGCFLEGIGIGYFYSKRGDGACVTLELELELIQAHSIQKPMLPVEGARAHAWALSLLMTHQARSAVSLCSVTNKQGTAESLSVIQLYYFSDQNSGHDPYSRTDCGLIVISS